MRRHGNHQRKILLVVLAGLVLLPAVVGGALRPKLVVYAENYVQYRATSKMERAVADCAEQMEEIGKLHQDDSGAVTALTTNAAAVNRIRTQLVQRVYDEIGELEQAQTSVALGTLLDPQLLAGLGPQIPFRVVSLGCVTAQVESHFSSAGINQTLYEVSVTVSADFSLQLLGAAKSITVRANYPLEETILVGDVPMISSNSK
jgi:sporulation protein YunB